MAELDDHGVQAVMDHGCEDKAKAQEYYGALDESVQAEIMATASEYRVSDRVATRLLGTKEKPGAIQSLMSDALTGHTKSIDEVIKTTIHQRLDAAGVKPNPGAGPKPKPKDNEPVVPEGYVPAAKVDELRAEIRAEKMTSILSTALSKSSPMPGMHDMLLRELKDKAERDDDGNITVKMRDGDGVLRAMSPDDAVGAMRSQLKGAFEAKPAGGTGGGEGGGGGNGQDKLPKDLPRVKSMDELIADPNLHARYIEEAPEELKKLEESYGGGTSAEAAAILAGRGISAESQVETALARARERHNR